MIMERFPLGMECHYYLTAAASSVYDSSALQTAAFYIRHQLHSRAAGISTFNIIPYLCTFKIMLSWTKDYPPSNAS